MIRAVAAFVVIALLAAGAAWLADHPGRLAVDWGGLRIETSVAVALVAVAAIVLVAGVVDRLWRWLRRGPARFGSARSEARRRRGYLALTQGLAAVAAGDGRAAARHAREAEKLLGEPPLTLLLSAQAAQLNGDEAAAEQSFTAMLERPETEFLGLRGLVVQATRRGDSAAALGYARRAFALRPDTPWVLKALFELQAAEGLWRDARATLAEAVKRGAVDAEEGRRRKALLLHCEARDAEAEGRTKEALALAQDAHAHAPGFVPAAVLAARLLAKAGKRRRAQKLLQESWARAPHPDLAAAFVAIEPDEDPARRLKRLAGLRVARPDHVETRLALAEAALAAGQWEAARADLEAAVAAAGDGAADGRLCRLMAELEKRQHGDGASAREWLLKAEAAPGGAWTCGACGAACEAWSPHCPACRSFDSLAWAADGAAARPSGALTGAAGGASLARGAEVAQW